jgi:hypothetical protein
VTAAQVLLVVDARTRTHGIATLLLEHLDAVAGRAVAAAAARSRNPGGEPR